MGHFVRFMLQAKFKGRQVRFMLQGPTGFINAANKCSQPVAEAAAHTASQALSFAEGFSLPTQCYMPPAAAAALLGASLRERHFAPIGRPSKKQLLLSCTP
jgi:hypothetical protein